MGYTLPSFSIDQKERRNNTKCNINQYQTPSLPSQIAEFCFPLGIEPTVVPNEGVLNQTEVKLEDSSHSHTFVINAGTGLLLYGACVVKTEMLRVPTLPLLFSSLSLSTSPSLFSLLCVLCGVLVSTPPLQTNSQIHCS